MKMPAHRRHDISDKIWGLLEPHLPGRKGGWGGIADAGVHPNAIYALTAEWMRCYAVCIQQGNFADKDWAKEYVEANYYACEEIRKSKDGDFQPVEKANERVTRSLTGIGR